MDGDSSSGSAKFNPFTEQTAGKYFVGREEQLKQFEMALEGLHHKSPRHFYVAGVHGTGKTSYLAKLVEMAKGSGFMATLATLDQVPSPRQHVGSILGAVVRELQTAWETKSLTHSNVGIYDDWRRDHDSKIFSFPRNDRLEGQDIRQDFETLSRISAEAGYKGIVACIDEGQRIHPTALSALKNALQHLSSYLVVISLRTLEESGDPVEDGRVLLDRKANEAEGDLGASRFYVTGLPLGPFKSDEEARSCIVKRLAGNAIKFGDDVVGRISYITGRLPRGIISLASDVYDRTAKPGLREATFNTLDESFRSMYGARVLAAANLVASLPDLAKQALRKLIEIERPATPEEVATFMYPDAPTAARNALAAGIKSEFESVCGLTFCTSSDNRYKIVDAPSRYALVLSLDAK